MTKKVGRCRLRSLLRARKMRQVTLAERMGMTKQQMNDYVTGRTTMSLGTARRFAVHLECSIDDLYEWLPDSELRRLEE
ncbi:MAG TPA: helix-turn-helix transcriptional regulator [Candidatus Bathyarchaeia archaeon]|nr:helix-turn-helix transcriptional regulator [Candidatus Bathyarchaeia archaeon]